MKTQIFASFVIYIHDCENAAQETIKKIDSFATDKFSYHEFVLVNDASDNTTKQEIQSIKDNLNGNITIINLARKSGLEVAMKIGVDYAIGDYIYEIDHPEIHYSLDLLYEMFEKATKGYDIVSLAPLVNKKNLSSIYYRIFKIMSKNNITLETEACRLLTRRAVNAYSVIKNKTRYRKLLYKLTGYAHATIYAPIDKNPSSLTFKEKFQLAIDILFGFTNIGITINLILSLLFLLISIALGSYALYVYFFFNLVISGWTTLMLFLSFGFSGIFTILAIFNKYFHLILKEVRDIPECFVASIDK